MSRPQMGEEFHGSSQLIERQLSALLADALRQDYGDFRSSVKRIGRDTGANNNTIKCWYNGRNAPNSGHLLLLARHSPRVRSIVFSLISAPCAKPEFPSPKASDDQIYSAIYCAIGGAINGTINPTKKTYSAGLAATTREEWILSALQNGEKISAELLVEHLNISLRTARRDIQTLVARKKIRFEGANKNGYYVLCQRGLSFPM